ncbi:MAG: glycoside hydrolase family 6 protein [Actinobacteria bacterium]|nr:glycoside hydrolase family 6 protein [Actinomycetota bacterium]MCG2802899.1 glycoside hydrolase family 6 protein [Cellulomonas sp.]
MVRVTAVVVGAVALALVLAACTQGGSVPASSSSSTVPVGSAPTVSLSSASTPAPDGSPSSGPAEASAATTFYADPYQQTILDSASEPGDRALLAKLADTPTATWLTGGEWDSVTLDRVVAGAAAAGQTAVVVLYNIPNRDCGNYSAGGTTVEEYLPWVRQIDAQLHGDVWVILEPDALTGATCGDVAQRYRLLHDAGVILRGSGHRVYLDAGHSNWLAASDLADRLHQVGADAFDGISLNVSNFETTSDNVAYAREVSAAFGAPLHVVVDTSRNGNGPTPDHEWCNPPGRALGEPPRVVADGTLDALLWIKTPGRSDGTCEGGPTAGAFWLPYALGLARSAHW